MKGPGRKTYRLRKDGPTHGAVGYCTASTYDFCWPVRPLAENGVGGAARPRTPAMAAGLTDRPWSLAEWLALPAINRAA